MAVRPTRSLVRVGLEPWRIGGGSGRAVSRPATRIDGASRDSRLGGVAAASRGLQRCPLGRLEPVLQQLRVEGFCSLGRARRASSSRLRLMPTHMFTSPAQLSRRVSTNLVAPSIAVLAQMKQPKSTSAKRTEAASGAVRPSLEWIQGPLHPAAQLSRIGHGFCQLLARSASSALGRSQ